MNKKLIRYTAPMVCLFLKTGQINLAGIRNNNIIYQNQIEQNKVNVNGIYIENMNSGILSSMSQSNKSSLEMVAWQPAILGGEGVYRAKAMLKMRLEDGAASLRQINFSNENHKAQNRYKGYPNPAKECMYIEGVDENIIKEVRINDIQGRLIFSGVAANGKIKIETRSWKNGIYIANILDCNDAVSNIKLTIIN